MNKQNILKAIELAENPGGCKYFSEGLPSCVVGQLFAMEGAKEEEFKGFNESSIFNCLDKSQNLQNYLKDYPGRLLERLQDCWDFPLDTNETISDRKNKLIELVINYEG